MQNVTIDFAGVPRKGTSPLTVDFTATVNFYGEAKGKYVIKTYYWYFDYKNYPTVSETSDTNTITHVYSGYYGQTYDVRLKIELKIASSKTEIEIIDANFTWAADQPTIDLLYQFENDLTEKNGAKKLTSYHCTGDDLFIQGIVGKALAGYYLNIDTSWFSFRKMEFYFKNNNSGTYSILNFAYDDNRAFEFRKINTNVIQFIYIDNLTPPYETIIATYPFTLPEDGTWCRCKVEYDGINKWNLYLMTDISYTDTLVNSSPVQSPISQDVINTIWYSLREPIDEVSLKGVTPVQNALFYYTENAGIVSLTNYTPPPAISFIDWDDNSPIERMEYDNIYAIHSYRSNGTYNITLSAIGYYTQAYTSYTNSVVISN